MIFGRLKTYAIAILAGLAAILGVAASWYRASAESAKRKLAQDKAGAAKAREDALHEATEAQDKARSQGVLDVQEAIDHAKTGKRDYFE